MPFFGAHMSVAGGLHRAFEHIRSVDGESLQIFTRNQRQWNAPAVSGEEARLFLAAWKDWGHPHVASHASYLINLASPKEDLAAKSVAAFAGELARCETLKVPFAVIHPGSHTGAGPAQGIRSIAANLDRAIETSGSEKVMVLLETTAGQGTSIGASFGELARIIELSRHQDRLGVCYDTCHTFAAGYDIRTPEAFEATFAEFERDLGIERLKFFHLNDSKTPFGSRKDRHEHIGQGEIGREGFRLLVNDPRFQNHPMTLETDKGDDLAEDRMNLAVLRELVEE